MSLATFRGLCGAVVVFGMLGMSTAAAQTGTIAGTITDQATGQPVPAARVQVTGTNIATVTTTEGRYTLRAVPIGRQEVRVSLIGYASLAQSATVEANAIVNLDFTLRAAAMALDVVTVTATGEAARAREQGNAVSVIQAEKVMESAPISDFSDLLSGRASNVQVLSGSGTTGTGAKVRIRGQSSVSLSNDPVFYVDGVRVESGSNSLSIGTGGQSTSRINDINPEEIESVEIIKGPSAATLYGTQAANGVIRITTKRGVAGRPRWTVYSEAGVINDNNTYPTNYFGWRTGGGQCMLNALARGGCTQDSVTSFNVLMDDQFTFLRTGYRGQVGAQVSGGGDVARYFFSAEYEDELGHYALPDNEWARISAERGTPPSYEQYRPNDVKKVSLRTNVTADLSNRTDLTANVGLVRSQGRLPQNDNNVTGMLPSGLFGRAITGSEWGFFKPGDVFAINSEQDITRLTTSANLNWRPNDNITGHATVGLDYTNRLDLQFQALNEGPAFATFRRGRRSDNRFEIAQTTVDASATASFMLRPDLSSKSTLGAQYLRDWFFGVNANGSEFAPGGKTVTAGSIRTASETTAETITLGFYANQTFGWQERRYLDLGLRVDNNSAFGSSFQSAAYPKVQGSWVISEEPFYPGRMPFSSFRLRAAYGQSGVQPGSTDAQRFFQNVTATIAGSDVPGLVLAAFGNDSLKPERSGETEFGFDADFWSNRAHLEFTYYNKKTEEALVQRILPPSTGGPTSRLENIGSTQNKGVEFVLSTSIPVGAALVDLTLSGSRNANKLLTLGPNVQPVINGVQRHTPGYPLFGYWERALRSWSDANNDGLIDTTEVVVDSAASYLGSSIPRTEFALNGGVSLFNGRLRLAGQLDYRADFKQFNLTEYFRCTSSAANNCRAINDPTAPLEDQAAAIAARGWGTSPVTQGPYIEDASFLKLRELSLSYRAPDAWARAVRATSMMITVTGRNLATITGYKGVDPEVNQNGQSDFVRDFLTQPPVTYWTFRVNLGF